MKSIAVLLTVFNRKDTTLKCLRNLYSQDIPEGHSFDVYITDGGSNDGTVEAIRQEFPNVDIEVKDGVFWNRGMYASWERAASKNYDYYLWLNDDTELYAGALKKIIDSSSKYDNKSIIVGACQDTETHSKITYGGRNNNKLVIPNGTDAEVSCINGNIVLVPKYVFDILGNLDYYFTHSKGDFDYGMRAVKAGIKMYQVGEALGMCDVHPRIDKWCDPEIPFKKRWKFMNMPNGMPPKETFHLEKQTSLVKASIHFFTIYLRCLFPSLWIKVGKATIGN